VIKESLNLKLCLSLASPEAVMEGASDNPASIGREDGLT
jgi:hypothetical protein